MNWFKRHIIWTNVIVIGFEVIVSVIWWLSGDWFFSGSVATFGALHTYIFIWISILIASIAATNTVIASITARDSLKVTEYSLLLTRATQRPFLNIGQFGVSWSRRDGQPTSVKQFTFGLCNTGSFPADQVSVLMKVSKNKMDNQQHLFSDSEGISTICFPNDEIDNRHFEKVDEKEKLEVELKDELKVKIEIEYRNRLTQETHKTNRSYLAQYDPTVNPVPTPLAKEDYWD